LQSCERNERSGAQQGSEDEVEQIGILICKSAPRRAVDGWAFPRAIRNLLVQECDGLSVLHLFGGKADFGTRLDMDERTKPDIIGDAWLPPFAKDSFDVVIMDPPYHGDFRSMSNQKTRALFAGAAWIARKRVVWLHTLWIESPARCHMEKSWLVKIGRHCSVRCLQFFTVPSSQDKLPPVKFFRRGPAIRYNRWLLQPQGLPFGSVSTTQTKEGGMPKADVFER
jgi:hypothetical protein